MLNFCFTALLNKGIIAKSFRDLKFGDRFYYENGQDELTKFTQAQLATIRRASLARLICDTADVTFLQRNAFLFADSVGNPSVSCADIPGMDLSLWRSYQ
jgi:peroxidase